MKKKWRNKFNAQKGKVSFKNGCTVTISNTDAYEKYSHKNKFQVVNSFSGKNFIF